MSLGQARSPSTTQLCVELAERLRARLPEIEQALLTRVHAVQRPGEVSNPAYAEGLRAAVSAGLGYALAGIGTGDPRPEPVPTELLAQARLAAAEGVALDTVLRRYLVGHTLLGDFLIREAESLEPLDHGALQQLLRTQATLVDRLIAVVAEEYTRARQGRLRTTEQRKAGRVKQLLAGDPLDPARLEYDLELFHLGMVATGPRALEALRGLAGASRRRLLVRPDERTAWAWLGDEEPPELSELLAAASRALPVDVALAVGEPAQGLAGWRLTHRQALAALPLAGLGATSFVRYADVAMLASALRDDVLMSSLKTLYLVPLGEGRDGGAILRRTLRAYFAAERNTTAAAAALGIARKTVASRLQSAERRLGQPLGSCATELETALRLQEAAARSPHPLPESAISVHPTSQIGAPGAAGY